MKPPRSPHCTAKRTSEAERALVPEAEVVPGAGPEALVVLGRRRLHGVGVDGLGAREDGVRLLARADEVVLLAGQLLDLGVGVELLELLVEGGVLAGQDVKAGVRGAQAAALLQIRAGGEDRE